MKKFKLLFMSMVLFICLIGTSSSANASSYSTGKAVIPWYYQGTTDFSYYSISNITDYPINVTITFYNPDGSLIVDDSAPGSGLITGSPLLLDYTDQLADSTLTFTLNAHSSGNIMMTQQSSITRSGYGVIQWKQDGNALQGLVASGFESYNVGTAQYRTSININNGMPF